MRGGGGSRERVGGREEQRRIVNRSGLYNTGTKERQLSEQEGYSCLRKDSTSSDLGVGDFVPNVHRLRVNYYSLLSDQTLVGMGELNLGRDEGTERWDDLETSVGSRKRERKWRHSRNRSKKEKRGRGWKPGRGHPKLTVPTEPGRGSGTGEGSRKRGPGV